MIIIQLFFIFINEFCSITEKRNYMTLIDIADSKHTFRICFSCNSGVIRYIQLF